MFLSPTLLLSILGSISPVDWRVILSRSWIQFKVEVALFIFLFCARHNSSCFSSVKLPVVPQTVCVWVVPESLCRVRAPWLLLTSFVSKCGATGLDLVLLTAWLSQKLGVPDPSLVCGAVSGGGPSCLAPACFFCLPVLCYDGPVLFSLSAALHSKDDARDAAALPWGITVAHSFCPCRYLCVLFNITSALSQVWIIKRLTDPSHVFVGITLSYCLTFTLCLVLWNLRINVLYTFLSSYCNLGCFCYSCYWIQL